MGMQLDEAQPMDPVGAVGAPYPFKVPIMTTAPPGLSIDGATSGDTQLFVGGLPHDCTDEDLKDLAQKLMLTSVSTSEAPPLLECRTLAGRGCGYLRFDSCEVAEETLHALNGHCVDGWSQALRVQWAETPGTQKAIGEGGADYPISASQEDLEPTRLFVGQILREVDTNQLMHLFEPFGRFREFNWIKEKGILYVSYGSVEEAQAAMEALNGRSVLGVSRGLNVKFSQKRH